LRGRRRFTGFRAGIAGPSAPGGARLITFRIMAIAWAAVGFADAV
jgi:hypothetical protein